MQIYILTSDVLLQSHLHDTLAVHSPVCRTEISSVYPQDDAFLFVHDVMLDTLHKEALKALFGLPVMVLSVVPSFEKAHDYLFLGARGYGNAYMHKTHLLYAYETILEGNVWVYPEYISSLISGLRPEKKNSTILTLLSHREQEVAHMLSDGKSHKEIAQGLNITVRTVKAHATAIYHKLNLKDRLGLALLLH